MSPTEFRILCQIALATCCLLPVGLWWLRPQPAVGAPPSGSPETLGGADLVAGITLCGLMAVMQFGGKAVEMALPAKVTESVAPLSAGSLLMSLAFIQGLQLLVAWAWFRGRGSSLTQGLGLRRFPLHTSLRHAALMILPAGIISMLALVLGMMWLRHLGWPLHEQDAVKMLKSEQSLATSVTLILAACVGAPIVEEVLFRGLLYRPLRNLTNPGFAAVFSALIFGVIHLHLPSLPALVMLGFFFAIAYEVTGSLTVNIFMHALFNGIQTILAFSQHG